MAVVEVPVRGMTCRACEVRVGKHLRALPHVSAVQVSAGRGTARVTTTRPVGLDALEAAVRKAGYEPGPEVRPWLARERAVWVDVAVAAAVVAGLAALAAAVGLDGLLAGSTGSVATGGLVVALVLGLTAGVSTCMALVGGLVLAVSARHAATHPGASAVQRLRPHLAFNAGRVAGFAVGGAVLGALGSAVRVSGTLLAVLTLGVALVMVLLGVQLTGVSPRLAAARVALPARVAGLLGLDREDGGAVGARTALLGAASFLLPCGFTQTVQLYALSTADPAQAALVMAAFAVGTAPGLLGVAGLTTLLRGPRAPRLFRAVGVAVVAFAVVSASGAVTVLGPVLGGAGGGSAQAAPAPADGEPQVLRTTQDATGYVPSTATVVAGTEVRWEIDSVAPGCASALWAPDVAPSVVLLEPGVNVLTFTPERPGRLTYSCAMGMYSGVIEVVPAA